MPLISVIVPVYNAEKYIECGIKALVRQTIFQDMQIVFINDGSTDKSEEIIRKYERQYQNIEYIVQQNQGVAAARNRGLAKATGKFTGFMDIDDYITPDYFQSLYEMQKEKDSDITIIDFTMVHPDGSRVKHRPDIVKEWNTQKECLIDFLSGRHIGNNAVDKLFRTETIRKITFPEGYAIGEDMYFVYCAIKASKVIYMDARISKYDYILHADSAMNSPYSPKFLDSVNLSEKMLEDCKTDSLLYRYAYAHLIHEKCKAIENMYKNNAPACFEQIKKQYLKDIHSYKITEAFVCFSVKQFFGFLFMRISPPFYMFVHEIMKIG